MLKFRFFQILTILGVFGIAFWENANLKKKKFSQTFARPTLNTYPKGIYIPD
jgi:hypothetical protein